MSANLSLAIENDAIKPYMEIGAFEALWANGIFSFKQLREKLIQANSQRLSNLVNDTTAKQYYIQTIKLLQSKGINQFGVKFENTIDYPTKLHDADYPMPVLYHLGNWNLVFARGISVVGTRHPSFEGIQRTKYLVRELIKNKFIIYSGLAKGIDTVAHEAAIEYKGQTVAVIGTPLWYCYPKENKFLFNKITNHHLLISQVPIVSYKDKGIKFTRMFFPERNKTMSALSEATIIVEADETSGSLIQARAALKQHRKVFILNNNFEKTNLTWPQKFLKLGAIRANNIEDILTQLDCGI